MRAYLSLFLLLLGLSGPASSGSCPSLMADIDAIVERGELDQRTVVAALALRDEGEAQHEAGDHDQAMASLRRSLALLGQPVEGESPAR